MGAKSDNGSAATQKISVFVRGYSLVVLFFVLSARSLFAHPSPYSAVLLDFYRDGVGAELTLPLPELELSFKKPLSTDPKNILPKYERDLRDYVLAHVDPQTEDGRKWTVDDQSMETKLDQSPVDLVVHLMMRPPANASARKFVFTYSVINHEVRSHYALVSVRNDWNTAVFSSKPEMLGNIHFLITSLNIDRTKGSWGQGFRSVFSLGIHHIAEGTDHLLFLLVLLLPAPLLVSGKNWGGFGGPKRALVQLLKIVSAFTVGHSFTLLLGATGILRLPSHPVEILIAVSIFVSAIHAIRPWFAGKEVFIAAGFGLIHGLAFADSISQFGFSPWFMACTVLGFNLGIETMQLIVVIAIIPWLIMFSVTRFYTPVRATGASFGGIAALGWIGERAFGWHNPIDPAVNFLASHPFWLVGSLAVLSFAALAWDSVTNAPVLSECETEPFATPDFNHRR